MMAKWGIFLCDCRRTLSVDPRRLALPTPYVQLASSPETDAHTFAALARRERFERVLIGCCAGSSPFDKAFKTADVDAAKISYVNLHEPCFWVHGDASQAHAKASRLLRAAMQTAEVQAEPAYQPLHAGGHLLIVTDMRLGIRLAQRLSDVAQPVFIVDAGMSDFDVTTAWRVYRGQVTEV